jgi:hypothetical protein
MGFNSVFKGLKIKIKEVRSFETAVIPYESTSLDIWEDLSIICRCSNAERKFPHWPSEGDAPFH